MREYIRSMRPETWPLASLATLFSGMIAMNFVFSAENILLLIQPIIMLCIMVLGGINMFNEVYDTKHDKINKPGRPIVSGSLSVNSAKKASLGLFAAALLWALALDTSLFIFTTALVFLGIAYSLPGIRFKDNAITSMLTLGLGYGVLMPLAPWLILPGADLVTGALIVLMSFMWFAGTTNFKDFKDLPGDMAAETHTLVARHGEKFTLKLMALLMVFIPTSMLIAYVAAGLFPIWTVVTIASLMLTLWVITDLYKNYSPARAYRGYGITYLLYPLFFFLLTLGFIGGT